VRENWKPYWTREATGRAAVAIMERFTPWLGERRRSRRDEILAQMRENVGRRSLDGPRLEDGCPEPRYARERCKQHYFAWHHRNGRVDRDLRFHQNRRT
jgi:hypothetical protein